MKEWLIRVVIGDRWCLLDRGMKLEKWEKVGCGMRGR